MQTVRPNHHTRHNHPHDGGKTQTLENHRRKKDDAQHEKENPRGVGDGNIKVGHAKKGREHESKQDFAYKISKKLRNSAH